MQNEWPQPDWIAALPEKDRAAARVRFMLRLAAVYGVENGSIVKLSERLGVGQAGMLSAVSRGSVTPDIAVKIEFALGRERFPRELFNDIFIIAER